MEKLFEKLNSLGAASTSQGSKKRSSKSDPDEPVKKLEALYKAKLPAEYVQLQKKFGSFEFDKNVAVKAIGNHPVLGEDKLVSLEFFYGLEAKGYHSIFERIRDYKERIPATFLPIADGEMNDLICMELGASNYGKIYFWVNDRGAGEEEYFLIANNITELFLGAFVEEEDDDENGSTPEIDYTQEKYKKMNPALLAMLKKQHAKENKK